ncbi:MAG: NYN domain-containing protein [Deltaproteobacteria bacterium]|nr:NYN domain-containing protein [Deltaproteobacteria bacterium]
MGSGSKYEELGSGIVRRREKKKLGLFIDGTGLDRASRRVNRKVDMSALVRGVVSGVFPTVARYYTLIPYEDDSRQRAFLDAVSRAGLTVVVKRLPPKGVNRQVSIDVEMAADITAFALGVEQFSELSEYRAAEPASTTPARGSHIQRLNPLVRQLPRGSHTEPEEDPKTAQTQSIQKQSVVVKPLSSGAGEPEHRMVTIVCPSREITYAISLIKTIGIDTTTADFGQFATHDLMKSAAKWIDLSDSETIWRD